MTKAKVLVTAATVSDLAQELLRDDGAELVFMLGKIDEQALIAAFAREPIAAVLLRGSPPFTEKVFAAARDLKIIAKHGAGVDSVDMGSAGRHGVAVMVAGGANADAVAEHALAMMLSLARELPRFDRETRRGAWRDLAYLVRDFHARTVGILGYGQIGERTARLAQACGAQVVIHTRSAVTPPAGMVLVEALKSGRLAGAGLDTFTIEPPDPAHPLFALPNVLVTPHVAAATTDAMVRMGTIAANNIICWLRGEVHDRRNFLNPEVLRGA